MTRYIADYASYQGALTVADLHRAQFQVVNFKTSHALTTKAVHPRISSEVASARRLGMGIGTFHWLTGNHSGTAQADYAFIRLKELGLTAGTMHTVDLEEQTGSDDDESAPGYAHVRDYVLRMEALLGRPVALYTGDWWWTAAGQGWAGHKLTPYLMAAPNVGYPPDKSYPGDASPHWQAGYGGWSSLTVMQYAEDFLSYPGGGRSTIKVSKAAMRDDAPWRVLTGGKQAVATRRSQNGWPVVLDRSKITDPVLFGEDFPNGWLEGDVDVVFRYLITRLHREVEPIDFAHKADDWGYYVKNIEGSAVESNHSSGTAFDYNAHTHPMGVRNTYSEADRRKIRAILMDLHGVVRWGGDYSGRPDDMHFEIDAPPAEVKREADRIKQQSAPAKPTPAKPQEDDDVTSDDIKKIVDAVFARPIQDRADEKTPQRKLTFEKWMEYTDTRHDQVTGGIARLAASLTAIASRLDTLDAKVEELRAPAPAPEGPVTPPATEPGA